MKILIIEDSVSFNNHVKQFLEKKSFQVTQAFTINDGLKALKDDKFDFILLDLILPDGEGETIVQLRKSGLKSKIIVFTGDEDSERREKLFHNGILDFVSKQNPLEYLLNELTEIIDNLEKNKTSKILIVEDSKVVRNLVKGVLNNHKFNVSEAENGEDSLKLVEKNLFDLIILDLYLPDMTGEKIINKIRSKKEYLKTPIIVISSTQDKDLVSRVLKHGANEFIQKPFSIEELVLKTKIFLELSRSQKELEAFNKEMEKKVVEEVRKRKEQEQILIHKSRLASMGEMIGNIAHQWRQPLSALSMIFETINFHQENNELTKENFKEQYQESQKLIRKMSSTIEDFRNYFNPTKKRDTFNINKTIEETLTLYKGTFKISKVSINFQKRNEYIDVNGVANELSQALMVLLSNSKDAIVEKHRDGVIDIETSIDGKNAIIEISDNGGGIPEKIINKIFDPYFTTKDKDGTGVGLYMAKQIVEENMYGTIAVKNSDKGAVFTVILELA